MPITGTELSTISTDTSAGSSDHGKIVLLNSTGKVDDSMLPSFGGGTVTSVSAGSGISVSGTTAVTVAASYGSTSSTVCVGNDSRLSNDRTASGLRTATTVVAISSAAAPTAGQVLTATSGTAAEWQDFAGGSGTTWYWYSSSEVMFDTDGVNGDFAIIVGGPTGNGNIYQKVGGHWTAVGNIKGTAGTNGIDGTQIRSGTTAPDNTVGVNGDYYLRTTTGQLYLKASGTYGLVLTMALAVTYGTGLNLSGSTLTVVYGTTSTTACVGNDSRLSDDRTASGLRTTSTVVTTSGASAPSAGQVLTATSSTAANWQALSTQITVKKNGTTVGTRSALNLIEGSNVTITATDNAGSDRVDATITSTGGGGGGSSFSVATDIAPMHWWLASINSQTSGLVDSLTDQGSTPRNFTQSGTPRSPVATDGNGKTYLALDGSNDYYQAGAVADWKFLSDGSAFTIAMVYHRTALITGTETLLDTTDTTSTQTGLTLFLDYNTSTSQGVRSFIGASSAGNSPLGCTSRVPDTNLTTVLWRFYGNNTNASGTGATPTPVDSHLRRRGIVVSTSAVNANPFANTNPSYTLTLGRRSNTSGFFCAARVYEIVIDNKAWSDRQVLGYEAYAQSTYLISGM
jgi:hypothetical protein